MFYYIEILRSLINFIRISCQFFSCKFQIAMKLLVRQKRALCKGKVQREFLWKIKKENKCTRTRCCYFSYRKGWCQRNQQQPKGCLAWNSGATKYNRSEVAETSTRPTVLMNRSFVKLCLSTESSFTLDSQL